jgi:hypothetical protein
MAGLDRNDTPSETHQSLSSIPSVRHPMSAAVNAEHFGRARGTPTALSTCCGLATLDPSASEGP